MKYIFIFVLLFAAVGCVSLDNVTPVTKSEHTKTRQDLKETRDTVNLIASNLLNGTPIAVKAAKEAESFEINQGPNQYEKYLNMGIGIVTTFLFGGAGAYGLKKRKQYIEADPEEYKRSKSVVPSKKA